MCIRDRDRITTFVATLSIEYGGASANVGITNEVDITIDNKILIIFFIKPLLNVIHIINEHPTFLLHWNPSLL